MSLGIMCGYREFTESVSNHVNVVWVTASHHEQRVTPCRSATFKIVNDIGHMMFPDFSAGFYRVGFVSFLSLNILQVSKYRITENVSESCQLQKCGQTNLFPEDYNVWVFIEEKTNTVPRIIKNNLDVGVADSIEYMNVNLPDTKTHFVNPLINV